MTNAYTAPAHTKTFGAQNYKRGAFVGGFEFNAFHIDADPYNIRSDRAEAEFIAASWPKLPAPLHKFYVTQTPTGLFTISVHVETLEQATDLFQKYTHLHLYPLNQIEMKED